MMNEDECTVTWDHKETPDLSFISQGPKLTPKFYLMVSTPTVEKQKTKISKPTVASLTKFYSALAIKYANFAQFMDLLKPFLDYREAKQICDLVNCLVAPAVFCEWDQIEVEKFHNLVGMNITKLCWAAF